MGLKASKSTFLNPEHSRQKSIKNQPTAWHYFTSTLTNHLAVKKVSFIHKHFNKTWSSQKTTSRRKNLTTWHIFYWLVHICYTLLLKTLKKPWPTIAITCYPKKHHSKKRSPRHNSFLRHWQTIHCNYT